MLLVLVKIIIGIELELFLYMEVWRERDLKKVKYKKIFNFIDESILIVFIDYGNSETKPASEIYPLQESFTRLPAMAVACTLAEVEILSMKFDFIYLVF